MQACTIRFSINEDPKLEKRKGKNSSAARSRALCNQWRSSIAHSPLLNYMDPQEDEETGVNEIPAISAEKISAAKNIRAIVDRLRPW